MARYIVHYDGWFFEWSTVSDRPRTFGMRRDAFEAWHLQEYGLDGSSDLERRLNRAESIGSSVIDDEWTAEDAVACNRAGFAESELVLAEIVRIYCVEQRKPRADEGFDRADDPGI